MLNRGWRQLCSLRGERSRISVRAWLTASRPRTRNQCSLDPLTAPIVKGWIKSNLHPPRDDRRAGDVVSIHQSSEQT